MSEIFDTREDLLFGEHSSGIKMCGIKSCFYADQVDCAFCWEIAWKDLKACTIFLLASFFVSEKLFSKNHSWRKLVKSFENRINFFLFDTKHHFLFNLIFITFFFNLIEFELRLKGKLFFEHT